MAAELVEAFRTPIGREHGLECIVLVPSGGGVFDVFVDDRLVFSKKQAGRHAKPGEVVAALRG
ncbi:MAG: Rdx family protein [Fimbriimonadales bacterium]|nr:Rdx family protein [Fimbriimonadales bacterium]